MKIQKNAIFFPAISIATHTTIMKNNWLVNNKSPRFYLKNLTLDQQLFKLPYILTSAAHNYKDINFMKSIGINDLTKDVEMVFGDSGGFQIATGDLKETPELLHKLYDWMEANATLSPVIDHPPWKSDQTEIGLTDLDKALDKTKKNIDLLLTRKQKDGFNWLNVVHGKKYDHRVYWYKNIQNYDFYNGWALGSLRKNAYAILSAFASLLDNGELEKDRCKLIHFFGFSAAKYIPYIIYLKHKINMRGLNVNISFDSSYATQNGGWGKYLLYPSSTGFMSYHLSNRHIGKFKDVPMPCSCPVCSGVNLIDVLNENALKSEYQAYFYNVVQSHNVYMLNEYVKMLHSLIYTDCPDLWETSFKSAQIKVFKVIDKMFDAKPGTSIQVIENNVSILNKVDDSTDESSIENLDDLFGE
jgi:hypothetical protein